MPYNKGVSLVNALCVNYNQYAYPSSSLNRHQPSSPIVKKTSYPQPLATIISVGRNHHHHLLLLVPPRARTVYLPCPAPDAASAPRPTRATASTGLPLPPTFPLTLSSPAPMNIETLSTSPMSSCTRNPKTPHPQPQVLGLTS
jgi:hypothetical protein